MDTLILKFMTLKCELVGILSSRIVLNCLFFSNPKCFVCPASGPIKQNVNNLPWLETLKSNEESTHLSWVECVRDVSIWSNFGPSCWSPLYHHSKAPSLISDGYLLTTLGG